MHNAPRRVASRAWSFVLTTVQQRTEARWLLNRKNAEQSSHSCSSTSSPTISTRLSSVAWISLQRRHGLEP